MKKQQVCTPQSVAGKPPSGALTDAEMLRLMRAFTEGKTEILETDALTLVKWAQQMRMGNVVLQMVLDGDLTPIVMGQEVLMERRQVPTDRR